MWWVLVWVAVVASQSPVDECAVTLLDLYDNLTGTWHHEGWWQSGNTLESLANYHILNGTIGGDWVVENTYNEVAPYRFYGGAYDDDLWWALAFIRWYEWKPTKDRVRYLTRAGTIWEQVRKGAWDNTCGGGVWWSDRHEYKNAITNELFLETALRLYFANQGDTYYLQWAMKHWAWFNASGMINSQYLINDGLTGDCKNNGQTVWTYNQGVILGSLARLYVATKDEEYLQTAMSIADAVLKNMTFASGVLRESCEASHDCDNDQHIFKGVFVRYLRYLVDVLPQNTAQKYNDFLMKNFKAVVGGDRCDTGGYGLEWTGPCDAVDTATTSSAFDLLLSVVPNPTVPMRD